MWIIIMKISYFLAPIFINAVLISPANAECREIETCVDTPIRVCPDPSDPAQCYTSWEKVCTTTTVCETSSDQEEGESPIWVLLNEGTFPNLPPCPLIDDAYRPIIESNGASNIVIFQNPQVAPIDIDSDLSDLLAMTTNSVSPQVSLDSIMGSIYSQLNNSDIVQEQISTNFDGAIWLPNSAVGRALQAFNSSNTAGDDNLFEKFILLPGGGDEGCVYQR